MSVNILLEGAVFAVARRNPRARTGVFFVLRELAQALERTPGVNLAITASAANKADMRAMLAGGPLEPAIQPDRRAALGQEPFAIVAPFYPAPPGAFDIPRARVFQFVHDVASHACPELGASRRTFESRLMASIADRGHALCVSSTTRNDIQRLFAFPAARSSIVYPAPRTDLAGVGEVEDGRDPRPYVLALSTLEPRKNLRITLAAFERSCALAPEHELRLVIAGLDGWGDQAGLAQHLPEALRSRISFAGYVPDETVGGLLRGALCLLHPSLYEGFGLPVLEAMSCGAPVVASSAGALPEVIGDGGLCFDPHDDEGMARAIAGLARSPTEREHGRERGISRAQAFTWDRSVGMLLDAVEKEGRNATPAN